MTEPDTDHRHFVLPCRAEPFVLLEDRLQPGSPARLYRNPAYVIRCDAVEEVEASFQRIEAGIAAGLHAAGLFSYELGYALEPKLAPLLPQRSATPLLWFGMFPEVEQVQPSTLDAAFAQLPPAPPITNLSAGHDLAQHVAKVRTILALIEAGDLYQANLTFPMRFHYQGNPLALYAALRASQPVAHGGVVALGDLMILSASPELFVETQGALAITRPMKGTTARRPDPASDAVARRDLATDPKQRAENLMIVDLLRNDLSRISIPGSVRTLTLFTLESYPSFHALTSTIVAELRPDVALRERIAALFPCGSIVGAPKIRAGEIVAGLERAPRGAYTGSIGSIAPSGDMAFNVAIRSAVLSPNGEGSYGIGGGIVADSDPDAEYDEALLKARLLTDLAEGYSLIETLRWSSGGGFHRLRAHLDRLRASAATLGFSLASGQAETILARAAKGWDSASPDQRVRLTLARDGTVAVTHQLLPEPVAREVRVCIADQLLDQGDPLLRHKTSRRAAYDTAFAQAATLGCGEALLFNRAGHLADAARHSVFVRLDGTLFTPPIDAGALPGTLRGVMIGAGEAVERSLSRSDLERADALFLASSLNGLRAAYIATRSL